MVLVSNCHPTSLALTGWYFNQGLFNLFHGRYYLVVSLSEVLTKFVNKAGVNRVSWEVLSSVQYGTLKLFSFKYLQRLIVEMNNPCAFCLEAY